MYFVSKKHILLIFYNTCHICFPSINNADTAVPNFLLNCVSTFFQQLRHSLTASAFSTVTAAQFQSFFTIFPKLHLLWRLFYSQLVTSQAHCSITSEQQQKSGILPPLSVRSNCAIYQRPEF